MLISKILENIRVAYNGLASNKLRAILTILGITIGIGSVVALISVGQAVEKFVIEQFTSVGSNLIIVFGDVNINSSTTSQTNVENLVIPLTQDDVNALRDRSRAPDVRVVAPGAGVTSSVIYEGREVNAQVSGVVQAHFEIMDLNMVLGRSITVEDEDTAARVALIDERGMASIFNNEYPIDKRVRIGDISFQIVGVIENASSMESPRNVAEIYVPITAVQRYLSNIRTPDGKYVVQQILMEASSENRINDAITQITEILREEHNLKDDEENDFIIIAQTQVIESMATITNLLTIFLAVVAGISLLVGGIGIMNIMLVTVTERTKEIGLRKAVGARRSDILLQFLTESIILSLLGGVIGTALAALFAFIASSLIADLNITIELSSILLASAICISIGTFFGAYPANRAAALNPIDALRYE